MVFADKGGRMNAELQQTRPNEKAVIRGRAGYRRHPRGAQDPLSHTMETAVPTRAAPIKARTAPKT